MNLYPDIYIKNVKDIDVKLLEKHKIKGLILDIDNTLIDYDKNPLQGIKEWCNDLKTHGIKMCILSNTNKVYKVKKIAEMLDLEYEYFAHKPSKKGFEKARKILDLKPQEIAVVGDQIFTDVWGGNRNNMITILTKPIDDRDILLTKIKRPFEKIVIKRYLKREEEKK